MKRFRMDREPDCKRCHKLVGIILKDGIYHVTCSVSDKEMGKARVPSYCIRKQITGKQDKTMHCKGLA